MVLSALRWTAHFLAVVATFGFSFFTNSTAAAPTEYKTELHEETYRRVARRTLRLFVKSNQRIQVTPPVHTFNLIRTDLRYRQQLKIFARVNSAIQTRGGYHPRLCKNASEEEPVLPFRKHA